MGSLATATSLPSPDGLDTVLTVVATGALMIWALDEVVSGVNPWRRTLGGGVLVWQVAGLVTG